MAGDERSVGQARSAIRSLMAEEPAEVRDVAVLLTDEIVTNAVVHGGGEFTLTAELGQASLRVAVADTSPVAPRVLAPDPEQEHGRGMAIVETLATAWGTEGGDTDKTVWFELDLRS
jgi:anti-sigma regulatory factor (Ser/Thr protein kinase)